MRSRHVFCALLLAFCAAAAQASVFKQVRLVSVLPTKYFDIIFPKECAYSAHLIAENCDAMFEQAAAAMEFKRSMRMPVVLSPDNDTLDVEYTSSPYNRITVYDSLPEDGAASDGDTMLAQFRREVTRAVALSIRSPFWQFTSSFLSIDPLQPAYLVNMPYSFVEGLCDTVPDGTAVRRPDDAEQLQLLSQAKQDGVFPSWLDASGARDIYPQKKLAHAAGSAFSAYLIQTRGMKMYVDFWHAAGRVYLFRFTAGIFKSVYHESLAAVWNEFKESVPLPDNCGADAGTVLFKDDCDSLERHVVSGAYGTVWFDEARSEVDMLDGSGKRERLFCASDITRLSLSPDGRYMAVSLKTESMRDTLDRNAVRIYDIAQKTFVYSRFPLRSGCIVTLSDGTAAVAGIRTSLQSAELCIYAFGDADHAVRRRAFASGTVPFLPVQAAKGTVSCMVQDGTGISLMTADIASGTESVSAFPYRVKSLESSGGKLVFTYVPQERGTYMRMGFITCSPSGVPQSAAVQTSDVPGGINDPAVSGTDVIYSAHMAERFELRSVPLASVATEDVPLPESDASVPLFDADSIPQIEKKRVAGADGRMHSGKYLGDSRLRMYNPFPYMFRGTWIPMLPLYTLTFKKTNFTSLVFDGYQLAPGTGLTYLTQSDPLGSAEGVLSFSTAFADPADNYQTLNTDYSLSAYVRNSVLPVDIAAGGSWQFTMDGQYTLQFVAAGKWRMPLDMSFKNLSFSAGQLLQFATEYTDSSTNVTSRKAGWTGPADAFVDVKLLAGVSYSDYRQTGITTYEQTGFETGVTAVLDYDGEKTTKKSDGTTDPTGITFSINLGLKVPRLLPFAYANHFVLGMPLTLYSEWYGESGTSCESYAEALIVGWESQRGIPFASLYLARAGLKAGYDMKLTYDTLSLPDPDLSKAAGYIEVLKSASYDDYVYLATDAVLSPVMGMLTSLKVTVGAQYRYYIRSNTFGIAAVIKAKM